MSAHEGYKKLCVTYQLVDQQSKQVMFLFGFIAKEGEDECESLGPNVW